MNLLFLSLLAIFPRASTDPDQDLVAALRHARLTATAASICERRLAAAEPNSDAAARWTIALSAVRSDAARITDTGAAWQHALEPCVAFADQHPESDRQLWIDLQRGLVLQARAEQRVLELRGAPSNDRLREETLALLREPIGVYDAVAEEIDLQRGVGESISDDQWRRLSIDTELHKTRALLLRADCYPESSSDRIAAATAALDVIEQLIRKLNVSDAGWHATQRLRAKSLLALGRPADALAAIDALAKEHPLTASDVAVAVRAEIDLSNFPSARARLAGLSAMGGRDDPDADLAEFELLLAEGSVDAAVQAIDAIGRRHGPFWKRRAELLMIDSGIGASRINTPALIAAEAISRLQAEDYAAAGKRFFEAAEAALKSDAADEAVEYGLLAAAAAVRADQVPEAALRLADVAQRATVADQAPAAHLQAIQLIARTSQHSDLFDSLLQQHLKRWPAAQATDQIRRWRDDLLNRRGDHAARFELWIDAVKRQPERTAAAVRAGDAAVEALLDDTSGESAVKSFVAAMRDVAGDLSEHPETAAAIETEIARLRVLFDPALPAITTEALTELEPFIVSLARVRKSGGADERLAKQAESASPTVVEAAAGRLLADAQAAAGNRQRELANRTLELASRVGEAKLRRRLMLPALVIAGRDDEAEKLANEGDPSERIGNEQLLARLYAGRPSGAARENALRYWNRVAARTAKGSDAWAEAKLGAAHALVADNRRQEAVSLLRYALLTSKPRDAKLADEMRQFIERHQEGARD